MNPQEHNSHQTHSSHSDSSLPTPTGGRRAVVAVVVFFLVAVVIAVSSILPRARAKADLKKRTNDLATPSVLLISPKPGQPSNEVVLPGNISPFSDAPIFARTNGYLEKWYYDIGSHVKKGALLAVISTPEVDQQLLQAEADLATAQANAGNAKINAERYKGLVQSDAVSQQDTDQFTTQASATSSAVRSAMANVQRLKELQSFERLYAPFDGVVTARNTDIGQLIDQGTGRELFHMQAVDTLRVYVNVPQIYSTGMTQGLIAGLTFAEYPGRTFQGKLVRTARAIDPDSRTLLVEVDLDNRKGEVLPGAYTQVHFKIDATVPSYIIPVSALIFRQDGLRVGVVNGGNKASLVPIVIGQDDGRVVQVVSGIDANSYVIQDPPDSLVDGQTVHITTADEAAADEKKNSGGDSQE
jgi:RND family efflux transporter MFP subunit